ncbi:MAG: sulfurtransferase complex subunit TusB [Halieaceae bacterium]|nr:sulfurtransferase complex subunit TusB [Halieaceae bacterium]
MTLLHTVNSDASALTDCLSALSQGDALLLMQNAVYALHSRPAELAILGSRNIRLFALHDDLAARGLDADAIDWVETASYDDFVALAARHSVCAWY